MGKHLHQTSFNDNQLLGSSTLKDIAVESLNTIQDIRKEIEREIEDMKHQVYAFTKPPPKKPQCKKEPKMERMERIRIGYLIAKDIRIFVMVGTTVFDHIINTD